MKFILVQLCFPAETVCSCIGKSPHTNSQLFLHAVHESSAGPDAHTFIPNTKKPGNLLYRKRRFYKFSLFLCMNFGITACRGRRWLPADDAKIQGR